MVTTNPSPSTKPVYPEMSYYLPIWTQAYLEVKDLKGRMDQLSWLFQLADNDNDTDNEQAGTKPASSLPTVAEQFDRVIKQSLGITSRELLNDILGDHFALGWGGPLFRDQFGLVCRIKDSGVVSKFLTAGKAVSEPLKPPDLAGRSKVRVYRMGSNIQVAVIDDRLFILGTASRPSRTDMFHTMIQLAVGRSAWSLPRNRQFQSACLPIAQGYNFLFVLLTNVSNEALERKFAGTLFGEVQKSVDFISLVGFSRPKSLGVELFIKRRYIDTKFSPDRRLQRNPSMEGMVSEQGDLVYTSMIDPVQWYRRIVELSNQGSIAARQYRAMLDLVLPDPKLREKMIESLGPELTVIISSDKTLKGSGPTSQPSSSVPEMALITRLRDPAITFAGVDQIFKIIGGFLTLQNLASGSTSSSGQLNREVYHGLELHRLTLGQIAPASEAGALKEWKAELTWTMVEHNLIVSSSPALAHKLIDRAFLVKQETMQARPVPSNLSDPPNWVMSFDPAKVAGHVRVLNVLLGQIWQTMTGRARGLRAGPVKVVLGIGTREIAMPGQNRKVVQVAAVFPGYPAWSRLWTDDIVLAVDGEDLNELAPQKDLHTKVDKIFRQDRNVKIKVLRGGKNMFVEISTDNLNIISPKSMKLLYKLLNAVGGRFGHADLACHYAADGQIHLQIELQKMMSQP
ncbi:MAG: hypothetical protein WC975_16030 [Phycisphaerae bacterium]